MEDPVGKSTSTRLGQILLDKGLVTTEQLDIAIKEQQKRRQLLDPFDVNLGVNSSLGEILIELGFIDRLQLKRGLNWQLMLRKMAIVMSFCAPLMTVSYGAAAAGTPRPSFTAYASSSSSVAPKINPGFTKTSSSASSAPAIGVPKSSSSSVASVKSSSSSSSKASSVVSSIGKSSDASTLDTVAPEMPETITVVAALYDRVHLTWVTATDDVAVTRYKVYRDQVQIDTLDSTENGYFDFNVAPGKTYLYGVSAGDDAGNWSAIKSVFVQTAAAPDSGSQTSSARSSTSSIRASSSSVPANVTSSSSSSVSSTPSSIASSVSSAPAIVSSSSSSSKAASSSSSSKAAVSSSSSSAASAASTIGLQTWVVAGPVSFNWIAPNLRENGSTLDITEVGGYELRYRKTTENSYTYITVNDAWTNYYNFAWLEGTYIFQIAAFDKNGLYSNFVDLTPR